MANTKSEDKEYILKHQQTSSSQNFSNPFSGFERYNIDQSEMCIIKSLIKVPWQYNGTLQMGFDTFVG